ncbi:hypothetical protein COY06_00535 [Candidatus Peregrinibacteria bacterium CG_4_10_14_0_2_um_filter_41_8]|nr:MAG: hypothetical protein COY06_00535 [Candidatus Peregrinibacteria bacterium CG_4_10_14_0_2_um_filter_41_8]
MQTKITKVPYKTLNPGELKPSTRPFILLQGNWSILASNPITTIKFYKGDPHQHLNLIDQIQQTLNTINPPAANLPFTNGLIGFFSYDFGNQLLNISNATFPNTPLSYWLIPQEITIWDHDQKTCHQITNTYTDTETKTLKTLCDKASSPAPTTPDPIAPNKLTSNITKTAYQAKLKQINDHIIAGNTYQVNFAQQFSLNKKLDPLQIYQKISKTNFAAYQALIVTDQFNIISNSPELLISYTKDQLVTEPIKGTDANADRLLKSQKGDAELTMIVDLSRNDISKLSQPGTVKVRKHRALMQLKHFYHTYSQITGTPKPNLKVSEIIKAMFPGGSVTGCPKHRTMQIINHLEPTPRGAYCGSAGFINHNGTLTLNILIRTLWQRHSYLSLHAGGGIIADSNTNDEYDETIQKARAFTQIIT